MEKVCEKIEIKKISDVLIVEDLKKKDRSNEMSISSAIIPLKSKDKVLGVITICSRKSHVFQTGIKNFSLQ